MAEVLFTSQNIKITRIVFIPSNMSPGLVWVKLSLISPTNETAVSRGMFIRLVRIKFFSGCRRTVTAFHFHGQNYSHHIQHTCSISLHIFPSSFSFSLFFPFLSLFIPFHFLFPYVFLPFFHRQNFSYTFFWSYNQIRIIIFVIFFFQNFYFIEHILIRIFTVVWHWDLKRFNRHAYETFHFLFKIIRDWPYVFKGFIFRMIGERNPSNLFNFSTFIVTFIWLDTWRTLQKEEEIFVGQGSEVRVRVLELSSEFYN